MVPTEAIGVGHLHWFGLSRHLRHFGFDPAAAVDALLVVWCNLTSSVSVKALCSRPLMIPRRF
jgi:hypothetical protein